MDQLQWFFPKQLGEVPSILEQKGVIPHGGGTGILMGGLEKIRGLMDISHLPIKFFRVKNIFVEIGAGLTYAETIERCEGNKYAAILFNALTKSMSTPLRNRVTLGGGIGQFPIWSDLMGPLLALEAEVNLLGAHNGWFKVIDYVKDRNKRKQSLITEIRFKRQEWRSYYFRATRTNFDYPAFTITILVNLSHSQKIDDIRIVVIGCNEKFRRLQEVEDSLRGNQVQNGMIPGLLPPVTLRFNAKRLGSSEYLSKLAQVELMRGLETLLGR